MYHLLEFIVDGVSIPWKDMCTFYFCYCHNFFFFVLFKVMCMSQSLFDNFYVIVFLTVVLLVLPKLMRYHRYFREENFSGRKTTFRYICREVFITLNS